MKKYRFIDLFAGCGGLEDGFLASGKFCDVAAIEWLQPQVDTLRKRTRDKWGIADSDQRIMRFDIQREDELFGGWENDADYGTARGLDYYVNESQGVDIIIGGPPCQAYSLAGRVRDENGMRNDYRNYLFEHYLSVVNRYQPKVFVFENVPGILSAAPDGELITKKIHRAIENIGYKIISDLENYAVLNASDYGVPQNRRRIIIIGIKAGLFNNPQDELRHFYVDILPKFKEKKSTVQEAIGDLPPCYPLNSPVRNRSHSTPETKITWHIPRFHSKRDTETFGMLAEDLASGACKYVDSKELSALYAEKVGSLSPIHRYHVLRPNEPSTTIIAHLYKDGNRFIHYDPAQARTITPREAARLQSFDDDFDFVGSRGSVYQMIGNAVPPLLAKKVALAVAELLQECEVDK